MRSGSVFALSLTIVALTGCAGAPIAPNTTAEHAPLLDGRALFGADVPPASEADILGLTPAMRRFVDANGGNVQSDWLRLQRLLRGMQDHGFMDVAYENETTRTAADTFASRAGNCLSFTNMFVALARASRLSAEFQVVDVPPTWDSMDGWLVVNNHIDVLIRRVGMDNFGATNFRRDYVVDFNMADFQTTYPRKAVDDRTAFALFYSNRAVEAMRAGDARGAFANLKRAVREDPRVSTVWVNLGALYSREGRYDEARASFERALDVQPRDKSALTNLARLYDRLGNVELAAAYRARIHRYEDRNPYYHYALAERAFSEQQWNAARTEIERAIDLKKDDHRFFYLRSLVELRLGNVGDARSSLLMAKNLTDESAVRQRYLSKLEALGLKSG